MPKTLTLTLFLAGLILLLVPATASADGTQVIGIYAGQHTLVGNLIIEEGGGNLTVTYQITTPGWCFTVTHLHVGPEPPEKSAPGQFPYKHENLPCVLTDTYVVPGDSNSYAAAHAEVRFSADNAAPLQIPSGTVTYSTTSPTPDGDAYFNPTTTTGVLNGAFDGWCVDTELSIASGFDYTANVYSSYDAALPTGVVDKPENLDLVNYILNQDYIAQGMTYSDIQRAIWHLIDDSNSEDGLFNWTQANVDAIIADALANGEGFVPGCGQVMAVILDPVSEGVQHTLIEYPVPCVEPGPNRHETAWALASNGVLFGQGWGGYFNVTIVQTDPGTDATDGPIVSGPGNSGNAPPPRANNDNSNSNNSNSSNRPTWSSSEPVTEAASITPILNLSHCRVQTNYMLNLREGPGTEFDVIRQIPFDTRLDATQRQGDWFFVSYWNGYETTHGWLSSANNYLKLLGNCS